MSSAEYKRSLNYLEPTEKLEVLKELLFLPPKRLVTNPITTILREGKIKNYELSPQVSPRTQAIRNLLQDPDDVLSLLTSNDLSVGIVRIEKDQIAHKSEPLID